MSQYRKINTIYTIISSLISTRIPAKWSMIIIDMKLGINKKIETNNKDTYESDRVAVLK